MKKILVLNPKGGCGKTTVATNLASYYALWDINTALVDYDPQHSSLDWLAARPDNAPEITAIDGIKGSVKYSTKVQRAILDAPARVDNRQISNLVRSADVVIIPVLASPIDIRASGKFVANLLMSGTQKGTRIGVIGNRVKENTQVFGRLEEFFKSIKIPVITHLRDSQNYVRSAQTGLGVFDMAPSAVEREIEQWRPLLHWVEGKRGSR